MQDNERKKLVEEMLETPELRARMAETIWEEMEARKAHHLWYRVWPFLAGIGSGAVMILAFLLPSVEDQWDRYQSRKVIERYMEVGHGLMAKGQYELAEQTFAKAFELSGNGRIDIEEERLKARVQRVNSSTNWTAKNPEGLTDSDFLYLLELQKGPEAAHEHLRTLNAYAAFLAGAKRWKESEMALRDAIRLNASDPEAYGTLGVLMRELHRPEDAENALRQALALKTSDPYVHYNLGLVLSEGSRAEKAVEEFRQAATLVPTDADCWKRLAEQLEILGKSKEATGAYATALRIQPADTQTQRSLARLRLEDAGRKRKKK